MPDQSTTTDPTPTAFDPAELPGIEARLDELGHVLDSLGRSTPFGIFALAFGHRARSLWLGLRYASTGPSDASAQVILRALVEMTILLPWLAMDRDLHLRLWFAEAQRQMVNMFDKAPTHTSARRAASMAEIGTPERIAEMRKAVADARMEATAARVIGVGRRGPLVPSLNHMVKVIDTPAAREAYGIVYNHLSGFTHSGALALGMSFTSAGVMLDDGPPGNALGDRTMGAVAYAQILELVSEVAKLGIEDDARVLRARILATGLTPGWTSS